MRAATSILAILAICLIVVFAWPGKAPVLVAVHGTAALAPSATPASAPSDPTLTGALEVSAPGAAMIALQSKAIRRAFAKDTLSEPSLAAGEYDVFATGADGSANGKATVRPGETTRITLTLVAPANAVTVTGTIEDSLGGTVPGAEVWLGLNITRTDEHGVFRLRAAKGDYDFRVRAAGYADGTAHVSVRADTTLDFSLHPASALHGVVVHADGSPAGGARVTVTDVADTFTDAAGKFGIEGLNAGTYEVRAATATEIGMSERVVLTPASSREVKIELGAAVMIVGRVLGADGAPLAQAEVSLEGDVRRDRRGTTTTGPDGSYRFSPVLPSSVTVRACAADHLCDRSAARFVTGPSRVTIDVVLRAGSTVRLTIVDANGTPVEGAEAFLGDFEGCTSDAAGGCVIDHVSARRTSVQVDHPTKGHAKESALDIGAGETRRTVQLVLGGTVRGTVRWDDGKPAAGVAVHTDMFGRGNVAHAGPDGRYELTNVELNGSVRAVATTHVEDPMQRAIKHAPDDPSERRVSLKSGEVVDGIDLVVKRESKTIRGTVVDASGAPVASARIGKMTDGRDFEGATVFAMMFAHADGYSNADGTFTLENVVEGTYAVWADAEGEGRGFARKVAAGISSVVVKLPPPTTVSGEVVDDRGAPLPQFIVNLDGIRGGSPTRVADRAGHFVLRGVAEGRHVVTIEGGVGEVSVLARAEVDVKAGADAHVRLVAKRSVTLRGRFVLWPAMTPIAGVRVTTDDAFRRESTPSDGSGFFEIEDVGPGTRELRTFDILGHGEQWKREVSDQAVVDIGDLAAASFEGYGGMGFDSDGVHVVSRYGSEPVAKGDELLTIDGQPVAKLGMNSVGYLMTALRPDQSFDVKKKSGETVTLHRSPPSAPNPQNSKR